MLDGSSRQVEILGWSSRRFEIEGRMLDGSSRRAIEASWRFGIEGWMLGGSSGRVGISERAVCRSSRRGGMLDMLDASSRRGEKLGGTLCTGIRLGSLSERVLKRVLMSSRRVGMLGMLNASSRRGGVMGGMLDTGILLGSISERGVCMSSWVGMLDALDTSSRRGKNLGGMLRPGIRLGSLSERVLKRVLMSSRQVGVLNASSQRVESWVGHLMLGFCWAASRKG
jgi:hypothetical protein